MIDNLPTCLTFLSHRHSIIKVFCILAVYGNYLHFSKVKSVLNRSLNDLRRNLLNFFKHFLREFILYAVSLGDRENVNTLIIFKAKNLYYLTLRTKLSIAIACKFYNHLYTLRHIFAGILRYVNITSYLSVVRHYKAKVPAFFKCAYNCSKCSLNYLNNLAFSTLSPAFSEQLDSDSITFKGIADF